MGEIGTRRIAKIAKYLAKDGNNLHVLTIQYPYKDPINWTKDIESSKIHIHRIHPMYPMWLLKPIPYSNQFNLHLIKRIIRWGISKIFYSYESAQYWPIIALPKASKIINKYNIDTVIGNGPPYTNNLIASKIKKKYPHINIIQDFRDRWGSKYQKNEAPCIENTNHIILNTEDDHDYYAKKYPKSRAKMRVMHNGYDPEDYTNIQTTTAKNDLKIIYGGDLGQGRMKAVELIAQTLLDHPLPKNPVLHLDIYSNFDLTHLEKKFPSVFNQFIFVHPRITLENFLEKIANASVCLSINSPDFPFAIGGKVFDYFGLKKRIWHVATGGEFLKSLKKSNYHITSDYTPSSTASALKRLMTLANPSSIDQELSDSFCIPKQISILKNLLKTPPL